MFQQIGLHVHDLVFSMPVAGEEVLDAVGIEQYRAVYESGLFGAGVVPERVAVPEADVGRVLEGTSSVGAGGEGEEPAAGSEAAVCFLHGVDGALEVLQGVVGAEHADLAIAEGHPTRKYRSTLAMSSARPALADSSSPTLAARLDRCELGRVSPCPESRSANHPLPVRAGCGSEAVDAVRAGQLGV